MNQNLFTWFAIFIALQRLNKSQQEKRASKVDLFFSIAFALLLIVSSFFASRELAGAIIFIPAWHMFLVSREDSNLRSCAIVLFALSSQLTWAPLLFHFLTPEILSIDLNFVGMAFKLIKPETIQIGSTFSQPGHFAIAMVGACSSFASLSTAVLAVVSFALARRSDLNTKDFVVTLLVCLLLIAFNVARIVVSGWDIEHYRFWHEAGSTGNAILTAVQTLIIALSAEIGTSWAAKKPAA